MFSPFSTDELEELRLLVETSNGSSLAGIQMTYGDVIDKLITDSSMLSQCSLQVIQDCIDQLQLEKDFYWTCGVNEVQIIEKVIRFLEDAITIKKTDNSI